MEQRDDQLTRKEGCEGKVSKGTDPRRPTNDTQGWRRRNENITRFSLKESRLEKMDSARRSSARMETQLQDVEREEMDDLPTHRAQTPLERRMEHAARRLERMGRGNERDQRSSEEDLVPDGRRRQRQESRKKSGIRTLSPADITAPLHRTRIRVGSGEMSQIKMVIWDSGSEACVMPSRILQQWKEEL
jgi:hypothetical protein